MPKTAHAVAAKRKKKKILKATKGYWGTRKNVWTVAKTAHEKALQYAYIGRKQKKRQFRSLWIQRINAACRMHRLSYSRFIKDLEDSNIQLNRKVLADLAMNHPKAFASIISIVKQ